jgi:hypothetical protein
MRFSVDETRSIDLGQPVQVKMNDGSSEPLELRAQIQLYATNELVLMQPMNSLN